MHENLNRAQRGEYPDIGLTNRSSLSDRSSYLRQLSNEHFNDNLSARRGIFDLASGAGSVLVDHAAPPLVQGMPTRGDHDNIFVKAIASATEGLGACAKWSLYWTMRVRANFAHVDRALTDPTFNYRFFWGVSSSKEQERFKRYPNNYTPIETEFSESLQKISEKLFEGAARGCVIDGKGVAVINKLVPVPVPGLPSYGENDLSFVQEIADWHKKFPGRTIRTSSLTESEDHWLSNNPIVANAGISSTNHRFVLMSILVVFDEKREYAAQNSKPAPGFGSPEEQHDKGIGTGSGFYRWSQDLFNAPGSKEARAGSFASNGWGSKMCSVICPPPLEGERSIFEMQEEFCRALADCIVGDPRFKDKDVFDKMQVRYKLIKDNHFMPISFEDIPYGKHVGGSAHQSYKLHALVVMKDPIAATNPNYQGWPPPDSENFTHLPWHYNLKNIDLFTHPLIYTTYYHDQCDHIDDSLLFGYLNPKSKKPYIHLNIVNGIVSRGGHSSSYFEFDSPNCRGGEYLTEERSEAEAVKMLRAWWDRPSNVGKRLISIDYNFNPRNEYTDPGHWNFRRQFFIVCHDAGHEERHKNDPIAVRHADRFIEGQWVWGAPAIAANPATPFEHRLEESYRDNRAAYIGVQNADGVLWGLVDHIGAPQIIGASYDSPRNRQGTKEGSRRFSLKQFMIALANRFEMGEATHRFTDVRWLTWFYGHHKGTGFENLDYKCLFRAEQKV